MFGLIFLARIEKRLLVRYIDSGILPTIFWIALRCYVCSRVAVCLWHCIFGSNIGKRNISVAAEIAYFPRSKSPYARHEMWRYSAMASCVRDSRRRSARSSFEISFASKTVYEPIGIPYPLSRRNRSWRSTMERAWGGRDMSDGRYLVRVRKYHIANETMIIIWKSIYW